jgi:hypothetical protein
MPKSPGTKRKASIIVKPGMIPEPCSVTLVTSLNTEERCFWTVRYGTNTRFDFVESVKAMISAGSFLPGDILVLENAAVHTGAGTQEELDAEVLVRLGFLYNDM